MNTDIAIDAEEPQLSPEDILRAEMFHLYYAEAVSAGFSEAESEAYARQMTG